MKLSALAPLFVLCSLGASAAAVAAGSAEKGESKSTACIACHGPSGNSSNPEWPNLAGQHEHYILKQLQAFKSGARKNPLMTPMAAGLSDDDMADLGAYFAAQKRQAWRPILASCRSASVSIAPAMRRTARRPAPRATARQATGIRPLPIRCCVASMEATSPRSCVRTARALARPMRIRRCARREHDDGRADRCSRFVRARPALNRDSRP